MGLSSCLLNQIFVKTDYRWVQGLNYIAKWDQSQRFFFRPSSQLFLGIAQKGHATFVSQVDLILQN